MWNDLRDYPTDILKERMKGCLESEDYLHCARIRDELGRRKTIKNNDRSIHGIASLIVCIIIYTGAVLFFILLASWVITSIGNFINSLFA